MTTIYIKDGTGLPKRRPMEYYRTEWTLAMTCMQNFGPPSAMRILDPGCGMGVWAWAARKFYPEAVIYGVDLLDRKKPNNVFNHFIQANFLTTGLPSDRKKFDLIIGNPPYDQAEEFIRHSLEMLSKRGRLYFLLRLAFLASVDRYTHLWKETPLDRVIVCARRPSFYGRGTNGTDYGVFVWDNAFKSVREPKIEFMLHEREPKHAIRGD